MNYFGLLDFECMCLIACVIEFGGRSLSLKPRKKIRERGGDNPHLSQISLVAKLIY